MGIKTPRQKPRSLLLSFIYRAQKLLPFSSRRKLNLFLDLEWIFDRLSHEMSFRYYDEKKHPVRRFSKEFILQNIDASSVVLDLGCNLGEISNYVAEKAKEVVGIDHNPRAIAIAEKRYKKSNLSFVNKEALEFLKSTDKKFNTLILSHILEHLDDPKNFIMTYKGYFEKIYIELPDFNKSYLNTYRKDLDRKLIYTDDDHITEFDRYELSELLNSCGIKIEKEEYQFGVQKLWCRV